MGVDKTGSGQIGEKSITFNKKTSAEKKGVDEIGRRRIVWLICSLTCRLKKFSHVETEPSLPGYEPVLWGA